MMRFTMFTAASTCYQEVADLCVPSWRRNSGAEKVQVFSYDDPGSNNICTKWHSSLIVRAKAWADAVRKAVADNMPIVLMDVDCLVLSPISGGFGGEHPIGIARWPWINIGVVFVDVRLEFPFVEFFDDFVNRLERTPQGERCVAADQHIMREKLKNCETAVNKLPAKEWNFTFSVRDGPERIALYPDGRIIHLHWSVFHHLGIAEARRRLEPLFPEAFSE